MPDEHAKDGHRAHDIEEAVSPALSRWFAFHLGALSTRDIRSMRKRCPNRLSRYDGSH